MSITNPDQLLAEAESLLHTNDSQQALEHATKALKQLQSQHGADSRLTLPALSLLADIQLELGEREEAFTTFSKAASIDPDGSIPAEDGGGPEKFLNLAQLDETGGRASLAWFEKAVTCLDANLATFEARTGKQGANGTDEEAARGLVVTRITLVHALCGMCELWMTDLSFEEEAEEQCERLISRAILLGPEDAEPLQTLASIRLSQERVAEAQAALEQSLDLWTALPVGHPLVPDFAVRIQLARTLMEAGMEGDALEVCERLVGEDDQSVEAWYLGGWCQYMMAADEADEDEEEDSDAAAAGTTIKSSKDTQMAESSNGQAAANDEEDEDEEEEEPLSPEDRKALRLSSREWLRNCLKLCALLEHEDDRLKEHATELVAELDTELGDAEIAEDEDGGEEEWEGIESGEDDDEDEDAEMQG